MKVKSKLILDLELATTKKITEILNTNYMIEQIHVDIVGNGINTEIPYIIKKQMEKRIKLIKLWNNIK